ncbi:hypothetical protein PV326_012761 [Microctonus aethiopoides]|nr:hypothetical protein PV326_012761 [Microctonus aethiopoides]
MKMVKKKWVLVFWPETSEISIVTFSDIAQAVNIKFIKVGWNGDLPWVDENNITTLYEATLLKISKNKLFLEHLDVDIFGRIRRKQYLDYIRSEMKKGIAKKKEEKKIQESTSRTINKQIMNLPLIKLNHHAENSNSGGKEKGSGNNPPSTTSPLLANCANCAQCICKNWRTEITLEYILQFEQHLYMMKQFYGIHSPLSNVNEEVRKQMIICR